ncbi:MAG: alpha/beta fold hydrolase [Deltaproteobacteria bacterium]|nr:alpha/beta fold hydrolase [Deltaproteobacteria bacterium]
MDVLLRRLMGESVFLRENPTTFLEAGTLRIHYLHAGAGRPLILIHGGGMWLYSFRHNIPALCEAFSVYALDMPGYGFSSLDGHSASMKIDTMRGALRAFMDGLGIERASILGHSWGGGWALDFALAHPQRVDRIVLIDSGGLDVSDVAEWEILKLPIIGRFLLGLLTPRMIRQRLERSFSRKGCVDDAMVREVRLPFRLPANRRAQASVARGLSWKETEQGLGEITHPVLLIWGDHDKYLDVSLSGRFKARIRDIQVEIIKNCGHSAHEEQSEKVNRLVAEFLKK